MPYDDAGVMMGGACFQHASSRILREVLLFSPTLPAPPQLQPKSNISPPSFHPPFKIHNHFLMPSSVD
jgi:hypothetical protein